MNKYSPETIPMSKWNEKVLFDYLKENIVPDIEWQDYVFSRSDCHTKLSIIELKCRKIHYDNMMIEKQKYNDLREIARIRNKKAIYINSTPRGVYLWDITNLDLKWYNQEIRHTTEFEDNTKVSKEVGYLSILDARKLKG
jgi:hypothetical protein